MHDFCMLHLIKNESVLDFSKIILKYPFIKNTIWYAVKNIIKNNTVHYLKKYFTIPYILSSNITHTY